MQDALTSLEARAIEDGRWWAATSSHVCSSAASLGAEAWAKKLLLQTDELGSDASATEAHLGTIPAAVVKVEGSPSAIAGGGYARKSGKVRDTHTLTQRQSERE